MQEKNLWSNFHTKNCMIKIFLYTKSRKDHGFFRGGGAIFQIKLQNFCQHFLGWQNWLYELAQITRKAIFVHMFCAAGKNLKKKQAKKKRFETLFGKGWPKNHVISRELSPQNL